MVSPFSLRKAGLHLTDYVFIPMLHNLRITVSFLVNSGHMAGGQSLEFFPIVAGLGKWSHELKTRRVLFFPDNEIIVYVINKQTTKDPKLLRLLRALVLICLKNKIILFRVRHIRGTKNILADH